MVLEGLTSSHSTHYRSFRIRFYRSDDPTNSVIALEDGSLPGQGPIPQAKRTKHAKAKKCTVETATHATKPPDDFLGDKLNVGRSQRDCRVSHDLSLDRPESTGDTPL